MHVEVFDRLAAVVAGIDDEAVAFGEVLLAGDLGGGGEQMSDQSGVFGGSVCERGEVLPGDDEDVDGCLRVDVGEGEQLLVLVEASDGDCAGGDLAEEAVGGHRFRVGSGRQKVKRMGSDDWPEWVRSRYFLKYFGSMPGAHGS